jgi:threonine aldolase
VTSEKISFASDNYSGIHPDILAAIAQANLAHVPAYGSDVYTAQALETFREHFGKECEVFFVFNGTAANVMSLCAMSKGYHAVICSEKAHIQMDECGAPEKISGSKLLLVPTKNGKITVEAIHQHLARLGDQHHVQPRIISISQTTELGTVYTPREIHLLAEFAHQNKMYLHMDGARIANAAASLNLELKAISKDVGVDALSFGGTKNGMMFGEAVVFFNPGLADDFQFIRKQNMQLASKMRFISAQFQALLSNDLWRKNASHANAMAKLFAEKLMVIPEITLTQKVEANAIFAIFPQKLISMLQEKFHFYVWDEQRLEVRLMASFDSTEDEINAFIDCARMCN